MDGRKDYLEKHEKGTLERDLALLLDHVGLTGLDVSLLGGNHPNVVQLARLRETVEQALGETGDTSRIQPSGGKAFKAVTKRPAPGTFGEPERDRTVDTTKVDLFEARKSRVIAADLDKALESPAFRH